MKIKILQRYLLAEFLKYLAVALLSLAAFYIVVDFISNIGAFTKHSPDAGYVILYFLYKLPEIIYRVLPLSALLSTLLTITFLNKNNENNKAILIFSDNEKNSMVSSLLPTFTRML